MSKIEEKVEELVTKDIQNLGYELYDIEYAKEGKDYYLRIFIDSDKGIDLNDCEKVSDAISDLLDKADYIKEQYYLEISSPGIERVLRKDKHLKNNIGNKVQINLFKQINGKKQIEGILQDFNIQNVLINTDEELQEIDRKNISLIKTVYDWN